MYDIKRLLIFMIQTGRVICIRHAKYFHNTQSATINTVVPFQMFIP